MKLFYECHGKYLSLKILDYRDHCYLGYSCEVCGEHIVTPKLSREEALRLLEDCILGDYEDLQYAEELNNAYKGKMSEATCKETREAEI